MKLVTDKIPDLPSLYVNQLRLLLSAEEQFGDSFLTMIEKTTNSRLRSTFESQRQTAETHAKRVEGLLNHGMAEREREWGIRCKAVPAMIDETEDVIAAPTQPLVRDAGLVATAMRLKSYTSAGYRSVLDFARLIGLEGDTPILEQILHDEEYAEQELTNIAKDVNLAALNAREPVSPTEQRPVGAERRSA